MPYPEYMSENIFEPLDMIHSGFTISDPRIKYAVPHTRVDGTNKELPLWEGNGYMMHSSAEDMARFMVAIINKGRYRDFRLLKSETIELMKHKHSPGKGLFHPKSRCPYTGYGLGLIQYSDDWFGHGGSTVGFQSLWSFNQANTRGYIIMTNLNGILGGRDSFDSVWASVSRVEGILKSRLDNPVKWHLILLPGIAVGFVLVVTILIIRAYKR